MRKSDKQTYEYLFGSTKALEDVLGYIGATEIDNELWHEHMRTVKFYPKSSKYYRVSLLAEIEDIPINKNWRGIAGIGFDEDFDYDDNETAEMIVYHINEDQHTDLRVFNAKNWRDLLEEFFYMNQIK